MEPINILDARNTLSKLVSQAQAGVDVVIAKRGKPIVRLVPIADSARNTGETVARWLDGHRISASATRTPAELDQQIADERDGWQ
ncbi:type II toxin-antitoxin system prevent-host-death family antitoxin [Glaciihabitans sp. UYNi722]|uniref:type II toxin-antitoxin system Phd/YefM family antitoxin n=1 Tax=Glaciihabitans sp. UYNi722 TaxID=3156344 RepID=UPI00339AB534